MASQSKFLPLLSKRVNFVHRNTMAKRLDRKGKRFALRTVPPTTLPVDGTNGAQVQCPMDLNDQLGDCMEAMACHTDNIWTYGQGKPGFTQSQFDLTAIRQQYMQASGGDNGLDEPTLLNNCWKPGLAGIPAATFVDSLDFDITNTPLAYYLIDQFYAVQLMWSVPDQFINQFQTGAIFDNPMRPDPANGHGTPLADIDASGRFRLWTWGTWCFVSPAFVASVEPQAFVVFSARQFNPATGLDSKGRHITAQAALWQAAGGNVIPPSVIASFPPAPSPTPTPNPTPTPTPVPPAPVPGSIASLVVSDSLAPGTYLVVPQAGEIDQARQRLGLNWSQLLQIIIAILTVLGPIINPTPPPPAN